MEEHCWELYGEQNTFHPGVNPLKQEQRDEPIKTEFCKFMSGLGSLPGPKRQKTPFSLISPKLEETRCLL